MDEKHTCVCVRSRGRLPVRELSKLKSGQSMTAQCDPKHATLTETELARCSITFIGNSQLLHLHSGSGGAILVAVYQVNPVHCDYRYFSCSITND